MLKIAVAGALGHMGRNITDVINGTESAQIGGLIERPGHDNIGDVIDGVKVKDDLKSVIDGVDAVIDFTSVKSSLYNAEVCAESGVPIVIGTTGFSKDQIDDLKNFAADTALLFSPNMSVGVNLIFKMVKEITERLPGYEKEIVEAHHNRKVDSPSGTAKKIADMMASQNDEYIYGRKGEVGPRKKNEIGIHAVRGGNIVGEHTAMWISPYDRIELTHKAGSRKAFAEGAVRAALWLSDKEEGFYGMEDVLR